MSAAIVTTGFGQQKSLRQQPASALPAEPRMRLRLTRRGRVVFTTLASLPLIVWAFVTVLGAGGAVADVDSIGTAFEYTTVTHGDSLWAIAESIAPAADVRVVIDEIIRLNGLDSAVVEPGQRLALPVAP